MVLPSVGPIAEKEQELRRIEGHPCGPAGPGPSVGWLHTGRPLSQGACVGF